MNASKADISRKRSRSRSRKKQSLLKRLTSTDLKVQRWMLYFVAISTICAGGVGLFRLVNRFLQTPPSPETRLRKAQALLDKGYAERAKDIFSQILEKHSDDKFITTKALAGRADVYLKQEDFDRAIQYANDAINVNEYNGDAYVTLGRAYSLNGEHTKAIENFNEALEHGTKRKGDSYLYRGIEYYNLKNHDQSIADFNTLLKIRPKSLTGLIYRALAYSSKQI